MSAFLLVKNFWPKLKLVLKKNKVFGDYIKVGFINKSLKKVTDQIEKNEVKILSQIKDEQKNIEKMIFGKFDEKREKFLIWKKEKVTIKNQNDGKIKPFYNSLPIYKKIYDLFSLIVGTTRNFPKELQLTLGSNLIDKIIETNVFFREICLAKEKSKKKNLILLIEKNIDEIMFLLRLAFDQKAFGLDRSISLINQCCEISDEINCLKNNL
jgi:hypothetical protein